MLSLMLKRDGVPPNMIVNKSKEQYLGSFELKFRSSECQLVNSKTYLHWSKIDQGFIREIKRGLSRQLIKTGYPKRLWDNCFELQALIRSYTDHSNYDLDNEHPKTHMTGQADNIRKICEYYWYQWVMFCDQCITYTYLPVILGRYFGPSIDVGSAMN